MACLASFIFMLRRLSSIFDVAGADFGADD